MAGKSGEIQGEHVEAVRGHLLLTVSAAVTGATITSSARCAARIASLEPEGRPADPGWEESEANGTRGVVRNIRERRAVAAFVKRKKRRFDTKISIG